MSTRIRAAKRSHGLIRRACVTVLLTAGCACAAAGCGSSSSTNSNTSSATSSGHAAAPATAGVSAAEKQLRGYDTAPTTIGTYPTLKTAPPKGKTVVYIGTSEVQNVQVNKTIQQVAALAGWKFYSVSYDPANPATFLAAFNTAVTKHANYVMEADTPLPPQVISEATAHDIKLELDSGYPTPTTGPVIDDSGSYADTRLWGELVADEFVVASHGSGKAVEEAVPQYPVLDGFASGFKSTVKADCPKCSIAVVDVTLAQFEAGQLISAVISAVKSHPGYDYLVTDDGPFFDGIRSALSAAGISGEQIMGEVGDAEGFQAVKAGTELAWAGYSVPFDGFQMMDAAFRNAEGLPVPTADATQPVELVTHANAGSLQLSSLDGWNYPTNALQQFERVWKIK